ncbi:MAG: glycosyltransferase family 8 protein [Lachnospiraceae bacterium]|nr:glycosyltransferase family 8 protein [Lachnospiraceae bacterium]
MERISIVLASDYHYLVFAFITMFSVLKNRKRSYYIDFYIMLPENTKILNYHKNWEFDNYEIHYIEIPEQFFSRHTLSIGHITKPTYYRLLIPNILPNENKCLYLDVDILVCNDLWELYNFDISQEHLIAGLGVDIHYSAEKNKKLANYLQIDSAEKYFNAGVLVMNLDKMRAEKMVETFLECSEKGWVCQDQDVLNICCYGKTKIFPMKYNVYSIAYGCEEEILKKRFSVQEIEEGLNNPFIIHYAMGNTKPWYNLRTTKAKDWWEIAKEALPEQEYKKLHQVAEEKTSKYIISDFIPKIELYEKIVIFGCGKMGKKLLEFINEAYEGKVKAFWDNKYEYMDTIYQNIPIKPPEAKTNDNILIVISCQQGVEEVKLQLSQLGYEDNDIAVYNTQSLVSWFGTDDQYRKKIIEKIQKYLRTGMREN